MNIHDCLASVIAGVESGADVGLLWAYPLVGADVLALIALHSADAAEENATTTYLSSFVPRVDPIAGETARLGQWLDGARWSEADGWIYPAHNPRTKAEVLGLLRRALTSARGVVAADLEFEEATAVQAELERMKDVPTREWLERASVFAPTAWDAEERRARGLAPINPDGSYDMSKIEERLRKEGKA